MNIFKRILFTSTLILIGLSFPSRAIVVQARPAAQDLEPNQPERLFLPVVLQPPGCIQSFNYIPPDNLDFEQQVVALINQERTSRGLSPLGIVPELTQSARLESRYLADNNDWGHIWPDGTNPWKRMQWACYEYRTAGENIAAGYSSPSATVSGWMNSDGHRAAILNSTFTEIGVGYAYNTDSAYWSYWTANFGDR